MPKFLSDRVRLNNAVFLWMTLLSCQFTAHSIGNDFMMVIITSTSVFWLHCYQGWHCGNATCFLPCTYSHERMKGGCLAQWRPETWRQRDEKKCIPCECGIKLFLLSYFFLFYTIFTSTEHGDSAVENLGSLRYWDRQCDCRWYCINSYHKDIRVWQKCSWFEIFALLFFSVHKCYEN